MAKVISSDEIKKTLPNYSPDKAGEFHTMSARQADKIFDRELKINPSSYVILLNGGTASGKTEFMSTQLSKKRGIIFDATLYTILGAETKIKKILKKNKSPIIYAIIPDNLRRAFIAFLNRDRKFSDKHFYETHSGSRSTLLWIAQKFPDLELHIIESKYTKNRELEFSELKFSNNEQLISYLTSIQISEDDIISYVNFLNE